VACTRVREISISLQKKEPDSLLTGKPASLEENRDLNPDKNYMIPE